MKTSDDVVTRGAESNSHVNFQFMGGRYVIVCTDGNMTELLYMKSGEYI